METVQQHGRFERIGPVQLPLKLDSGQVSKFNSWFFSFPQGDYNVLVREWGKNPFVRIQSKCIWGIEFGSQYCDCKEQLEKAKELVAEDGGLIVYAHNHNGKAVGLRNHNLVYAEGQHRGCELVVDAYTSLGFDEDYRTYEDVVDILKYFGIESMRLLTNSPSRIKFFREKGMKITRVALEADVNEHNKEELTVKKKKLGHLLSFK